MLLPPRLLQRLRPPQNQRLLPKPKRQPLFELFEIVAGVVARFGGTEVDHFAVGFKRYYFAGLEQVEIAAAFADDFLRRCLSRRRGGSRAGKLCGGLGNGGFQAFGADRFQQKTSYLKMRY